MNNKICVTRKFLSGWARHTIGILKQEKLRLSSIIDEIEAFAENRPLTAQEIETKSQANVQLAKILREEEIKWYQHSKSTFLLKEDSTTITSRVYPMADIGRNLFIPWFKTMVGLRAMSN